MAENQKSPNSHKKQQLSLCSGATGLHDHDGCRRGTSWLFCLAPAQSGANVGVSKCLLGKRAGICRAVWLAPIPFGVMKSSYKCMYTNREPMLTALQEVEWWVKHTPDCFAAELNVPWTCKTPYPEGSRVWGRAP